MILLQTLPKGHGIIFLQEHIAVTRCPVTLLFAYAFIWLATPYHRRGSSLHTAAEPAVRAAVKT